MSPVSVGELTTEVEPVGAAPAPARPSEPQMPWEEPERARRIHAEIVELHARTRAEAFDA